jgi:hypothetical protein
MADELVAEANFAFDLNTALFRELDLLAGFTDEAPLIPERRVQAPATAPATVPSGCPFANLGLAKPANHPGQSTAASSVPSAAPHIEKVSTCPFHQFGLKDLLVVLVMLAAMLMMLPPKGKFPASP